MNDKTESWSHADYYSHGSTVVYEHHEPKHRRTSHAKQPCPKCGALIVPGPGAKKHRETPCCQRTSI